MAAALKGGKKKSKKKEKALADVDIEALLAGEAEAPEAPAPAPAEGGGMPDLRAAGALCVLLAAGQLASLAVRRGPLANRFAVPWQVHVKALGAARPAP